VKPISVIPIWFQSRIENKVSKKLCTSPVFIFNKFTVNSYDIDIGFSVHDSHLRKYYITYSNLVIYTDFYANPSTDSREVVNNTPIIIVIENILYYIIIHYADLDNEKG